MSSTWGRPVSEAPPTGCSCHDPAGPWTSRRPQALPCSPARSRKISGRGHGRMTSNITAPRRFSSGVRGAPSGYTELYESIAEFKGDLVLRTYGVSKPSQLEPGREGDSMPRWISDTSSTRKPDHRTSTDMVSRRRMSRTSCVGRSRTARDGKARGSPWVAPRQDAIPASSTFLTLFLTRSSSSRHTRLAGER